MPLVVEKMVDEISCEQHGAYLKQEKGLVQPVSLQRQLVASGRSEVPNASPAREEVPFFNNYRVDVERNMLPVKGSYEETGWFTLRLHD